MCEWVCWDEECVCEGVCRWVQLGGGSMCVQCCWGLSDDGC